MVVLNDCNVRFLILVLKFVFRFLRLLFFLLFVLILVIIILFVFLFKFLLLFGLLLQLIYSLPFPYLIVLEDILPHFIVLRIYKLLQYLLLVLMFFPKLSQHTLNVLDLVIQGLSIVDIFLQLLTQSIQLLHQIVIIGLHVPEN